ncbi:MAG: M48 family metallopeptidase [Candidatus Hydrogenedentes bacterium]|nr:M48 family metallopeptidase [Candidatus Hydrogenedentota bacterium]
MWEQIRSNQRRSVVLVFVMLLLLAALGAGIGGAILTPDGLFFGLIAAAGLWIILTLVTYAQGDRILLSASGAQEIQKEDHPQLFNVVEEMTIASRLPKMPRVYIIHDQAMNAFATGRNPETAAVAITSGLLAQVNRDQLQGVIAHEIGHIKNQDIRYMTVVGIMLGAIVLLSELFLRGMFHSGMSRRYGGGGRRGGNQAQAILLVAAIVLAILAPILGQLVYFACSRRREYLADASAAVFTRYPEGLASALELLAQDTQKLQRVSRATAPMFIVNPLEKGRMAAFSLTSTHPPIEKRVRILRSMAGGAAFADYQEAWKKTEGGRAGRLPPSALAEATPVPVRGPSGEAAPAPKDARQRMRETGDILRKVNQFLFLACACGMKVKIPPEFKQNHIGCPRCGKDLQVPVAQLTALATVAAAGSQGADAVIPLAKAKSPSQEVLEIAREPGQWTSFKCACGAVHQLAPSFQGDSMRCNVCKRTIRVRG